MNGWPPPRRRRPFWQWVLWAAAWGTLIAFILTMIASSIHSLTKVLP